MFDKLKGVEERYIEIETLMSDPEVLNDQAVYQKYIREHAELSKIVTVFRQYKQIVNDIEESQELLKDGDQEIKDLARDEIAALSAQKKDLELIDLIISARMNHLADKLLREAGCHLFGNTPP